MGSNSLTFEDFDAYFDKNDAQQEKPDEGGMKCELKTFESRYNSKGEKVLLSVGSRRKLNTIRHEGHDCALVLTRFYDKETELEHTELEIRSPHVKAALKEAVPEYENLNLQAKQIVLRDHPKCLFHYRKELQEYGSKLQDPEAIKHLMFALKYMYKTLQSEIYSYFNLVEATSMPPSIDFLNLWMIFRSGDYIHTKTSETQRVLRFEYMTRCKCLIPWCYNSRWSITATCINYDGINFGYEHIHFTIRPYEGYKLLGDLPVIPLQYHQNKDSIKQEMIGRGKKFIGLHGIHHRMYNGIADALGGDRRTSLFGEEDEFPLRSTLIKGRIMVDGKTFYSARPSHEPYLPTARRIIRTENEDHLRLKDDDYLICHYMMPGFFLVDKKWCFFHVDSIKDVGYNMNAFETLMFEEEYKQMILSLVKVHTDPRLTFDDVIKGKGRGMIFLLHGVPGVGKTLTAESVADYCKRPLYTVTAGDIGTSPSSVELGLGEAFRLAETWNAIILIDEADVFLEQRKTSDLERNGLVSVILRVLEYYEGIMFLTTNRIGSFDPAFKSRIQLAIKYPALSPTFRRNLWRTFILRASPESSLDWLNTKSLDGLANEDLNGRQIKNIVRTAYALAASQNRDMALAHIDMALKAMKAFETDFAGDTVENRTEESSSLTYGNPSKRQRIA